MDLSGLKELKCPQNWGFELFKESEDIFLNKHTNWEWSEVDFSDYTYASKVPIYALYVSLSFETYRNGKYKESLEYLDQANITDDFMRKYDRIFKYVTKASRAHILYKTNEINEANQIIKELKQEKFNESEEGAFKYIESRLKAGYGEEGTKDIIALADAAIAAVKDEAEFHYNLAWSLGRIRHLNFPIKPPSDKELQACQKAVSLKKNLPSYSIGLARLYMDCRHNLPWEKRNQLLKLAASTFRNLLQFSDSLSGNDIARCLFNLMKSDFDADLEQYAELALKKSDTVVVNHYAGMFYIRNSQYEEAFGCISKVIKELPYMAGVILTLIYRINGNTISNDEIESQVEEWINYYESDKGTIQFHLSLSQFYLIVMGDFERASSHFLQAYKRDIFEKCQVNVTRKQRTSNYLAILKAELMAHPHKKHKIIDAAFDAIKKLPTELVSQDNVKWPVPSLNKLQREVI